MVSLSFSDFYPCTITFAHTTYIADVLHMLSFLCHFFFVYQIFFCHWLYSTSVTWCGCLFTMVFLCRFACEVKKKKLQKRRYYGSFECRTEYERVRVYEWSSCGLDICKRDSELKWAGWAPSKSVRKWNIINV